MMDYNKVMDTKSDATRQRIYATLRAMFKWLEWAGIIDDKENPVKGTFERLTPELNIASKCLEVEEIKALEATGWDDALDYAMVAVLSTTGVRIRELVNMKWTDCFRKYDPKTGTNDWFVNVLGKGNKYRDCFLPVGTVAALVRLRNGQQIDPSLDEPIFTRLYTKKIGKFTPEGARRRLEDLAVRAGITKPFTPHWFRHTFVSQAIDNGANPRDVQYSAGHSSFRSTEKYMWLMGKKVGNFFPVQFGRLDSAKQEN